MHDAVHARFAKTAERVAARQDANADRLAERVRSLLHTTGDERALDVGTGAGALAFAFAPLVREVVGVDVVPELLNEGRKRAPANVELVEADATALPFAAATFDLVGTMRVPSGETVGSTSSDELFVRSTAFEPSRFAEKMS